MFPIMSANQKQVCTKGSEKLDLNILNICKILTVLSV